MSIRKLDSQPVQKQNYELGEFERKSVKASPAPQSEPFSDVYESEIELKDDPIMIVDDTIDDKMKVNESVNEINELIDSISATTPVKSFEARNSSGVHQLEGSARTLKESSTPIVPEKPPAIYTRKLTDIFDYCVQELDGGDNHSMGKVDPPALNAKLSLEMEKTESAHP